jgi:hypothetical protein
MIYRKQGSVVRWENGTLVRVTESGAAREEGELFECWPEPRVTEFRAPNVTIEPVLDLPYERLIITDGYAEHEYGEKRWSERTQWLHASLVHGHLRALVDSASRSLDDLRTIANALQRAEPQYRDAPRHLRLAPRVTAALLPHMIGLAPPNVRLVQTAGGVDGYGNDIVEATSGWPNAWRPSYRVRPLRMPLNLRLECDVTEIDPDLPLAIALLAPVAGLVLRVLVVDRERVYPATVRVTRIEAVATERVWLPYGGGSFGAELVL